MDDDLIQRLLFAESDLLVSLQNGPQMLSSYRKTLSALPNALSTAAKTGGAGNETLSLAHSVASRISEIASCFLDIERREDIATARLQRDCDAIFWQMDALDLNPTPKSSDLDGTLSPPTRSNAPIPRVEDSSPFLASVYRWLLENLHNPYPTAEVKTRIAAASSCQVSSISSWFTNARRRIGWTTLCREHFSNCRADMVDAAFRALVEEDPQRTLSPELRHSFFTMKVAAEGLYSSIFTRSAFAGDLDAIVKDMTEKNSESYRQVKHANLAKVPRDSYPSPDRSITTSPVPALDDSLTDESAEEEDVAPPIIAGSKRDRSSIERLDQSSSTSRRPFKRLRASTTSWTYLPSPPSSVDSNDLPSDDGSPELSPVSPTQTETNEVLPSRKHRLSDADATSIPKHSRGSMATPRPHIVSDPLSRSHVENEHPIDDWFNTNFDLDSLFAIPPPVDATEPDFSASWEVELFRDYSIPGIPKHASKCPPASLATADTQFSASTDLPDLDSLLQSIGGDTFVTSSESVPPSDMTRVPYTTSLDSSILDIPQTNIDWTSLLNGTEAYQSNIYSTVAQYPSDSQPLSEIDLSMLPLPRVMTVVNPQADFASKQAKLHQLYAMQEAVRRMEQELQSEGVVV